MSSEVLSISQMMESLNRRESRMNQIFTHVASNRTMIINVVYAYEVDLDRINSERDLLAWVLHLSKKTWVTTDILHEFALRVASIKGLNVHGC